MVTASWTFLRIYCLVLVTADIYVQAGSEVPIKIVQEPASYGSLHPATRYASHGAKSVKRPSPAGISGPLHLRHLRMHCFNLTDAKYKYVLCPFHNVSQYETTYRWNAYEGVLGIWKEWEIVNNTFVSMVFANGDTCESRARSIKVSFSCGPVQKLANVSEPNKCMYSGRFESPHACRKDSMLVYPTLDKALQDRWDLLESQLRNSDITPQGYGHWLEEVFVEAGLRQRPQAEAAQNDNRTASPAAHTPHQMQSPSNHHFTNLGHCNSAYSELRQEVEQLNEELAALKLLNEIKFKMPSSQP